MFEQVWVGFEQVWGKLGAALGQDLGRFGEGFEAGLVQSWGKLGTRFGPA